MALKRPVRNAVWTVKGLRTRNPPLPERVGSVLFVCLGNICRSPFGAHRAAQVLGAAGGRAVTCTSAGFHPSQAARSPEGACRAAATYGLSLDEHLPQPLTREMVAAHDVIFVMEAAQLELMRRQYPEHRDRIFLMSLLDDAPAGGYERYNIADPFGQPDAEFQACYGRIDRILTRWAAAVRGREEARS